MDKIVDVFIAFVLAVSAIVAIAIVGTPVLLVTGASALMDKVYGWCHVKGRGCRDMRE